MRQIYRILRIPVLLACTSTQTAAVRQRRHPCVILQGCLRCGDDCFCAGRDKSELSGNAAVGYVDLLHQYGGDATSDM